MSESRTILLGAIAGGTIFLGLPLGRVDSLSQRTRSFLATVSAGILLFIFWDVVSASMDIVVHALDRAKHGGPWGPFAGRTLLLAGGFAAGAFGINAAERAILRRRPRAPMAGGAATTADSGVDAAALAEQAARASMTLGLLIAIAIGIHNFSEGLAIGVSARAGEVALAGTLIVGFALHNATEGFGIVGPLHGTKPSWKWLAMVGVIGGGPTFLGTVIGYRVSSEPLHLVFLALAAGAILFVVGEIWSGAAKRVSRNVVLSGIVLGFVLGLGTDLIITYGGV